MTRRRALKTTTAWALRLVLLLWSAAFVAGFVSEIVQRG